MHRDKCVFVDDLIEQTKPTLHTSSRHLCQRCLATDTGFTFKWHVQYGLSSSSDHVDHMHKFVTDWTHKQALVRRALHRLELGSSRPIEISCGASIHWMSMTIRIEETNHTILAIGPLPPSAFILFRVHGHFSGSSSSKYSRESWPLTECAVATRWDDHVHDQRGRLSIQSRIRMWRPVVSSRSASDPEVLVVCEVKRGWRRYSTIAGWCVDGRRRVV